MLISLLAAALTASGSETRDDSLANAHLAAHPPPPPEGPPSEPPGAASASCTTVKAGRGPKPALGDSVALRALVWAGGAWRDPGGELPSEVDAFLLELVGALGRGGAAVCWTAMFDADAWHAEPLWIQLRDLKRAEVERTAEAARHRSKRRGDAPAVGVEDLVQSAPEVRQLVEPPPDVGAPPRDAYVTVSGLAWKPLFTGPGGEHPGPESTVEIHYSGWTTDGNNFDSSITRGKPAYFPLYRTIPGWTEGLQLLAVGDRVRLWVPEALAYKGQPGKPAGMLVFDIELLSFRDPPPPPADVAAPPADATRTASGLALRTLSPGTGVEHPGSDSTVIVHYSGWTTDGKLFDSTVLRDRPATLPLRGVIVGFAEGVQQMVVGQKVRMWVPEALAYGGKPGKPAGLLVFDVELIAIQEP